MPQSWPTLRAPIATRRPQRRSTSSRSRSLLALAASLAVVIGGAWTLGGTPANFANPSPRITGSMGNARNPINDLRDHSRGLEKKAAPMPAGR
jgi:hypothetical protein